MNYKFILKIVLGIIIKQVISSSYGNKIFSVDYLTRT